MLSFTSIALLSLSSTGLVSAQNSNKIVSIPQQYTYLLPNDFQGNTNYTFVNSTHTSDSHINNVLSSASKAPIISYDNAFLDLVGSNPEIKLVQQRAEDDLFAYEAGVWVPERNEVWFTSSVSSAVFPPVLYALNLDSMKVSPVQTKSPVTNPNGGYYFQGAVYLATYPNNSTYSGGIVAVNVTTMEVTTVLNSYFGLRYNGIDDLVWTTSPSTGCHYLFFTDLNFAFTGYSNLPPLQLPANVYRWDPQEKVVLSVISRNEIDPNGVRVSPDMKYLYVTDSVATFTAPAPDSPGSGPSNTFWQGPYIYRYDLNEEMLPVNRRLFGMVRQGIADGLHIDDAGNVWTGESEGVVVRNPMGKTIGVFNSQYFQAEKEADAVPIANFALAGDVLVVLSTSRLWTVKLAKTVVASDSPIVN